MSPLKERFWWEREDLCYQEDGQLFFSGTPVTDLVGFTGTPAFFYNGKRIIQNIARLHEALGQLDTHKIFYAIKANRFAPVLTHVKSQGKCGVDVCSPNELLHAFSCGFTGSEISYTANSMTDDELKLLAENPDVTLNCDALSTIRRLGRFCSNRNIGLRVNPAMGIGYRDNETLKYSGDKTTKFGIYREQFDQALQLAAENNLTVDTIHFHTGCGYLNNQLSLFNEILDATHWFLDQVKDLSFVNLGGGLGVPHDCDDEPLNLDAWASVISAHFGDRGLTVCVEPGDYIVKDAGILVLEVNTVEKKRHTDFVGVNGGFNLAIEPTFYGLPCEPVVHMQKTDKLKPVTIVGNINESLDVWKDNFPMPDQIDEGDPLVFINAGGYASSMMSNHCMRGQVSENLILYKATMTDKEETLAEKDKRHIIHPWSDLGSAAEPVVIESGQGIHVVDTNGNQYIDSISGMWCVNLGYGNREMAEAIAEQCVKLAYYTPFGDMASPPSIELADRLSRLTPGDLNHFQFTNSGSTAVESAIRFVHYYFNSLGQTEKKHIICRENAYHGSTYLCASLNGKKCDRSYFHYITDMVHSIPDPNPFKKPEGMSIEAFCDLRAGELESKILELGPDKAACFIAEPVMGSGGVIVPPPGYHKKTLDICRKYGVLYISDEVVTAFGRLGHYFASEAVFGIVPDIITVAKGISSGYQPLGAAIISEKLMSRVSGTSARENAYYTNGYTYSGHPVTCAAALKYLDIMERDRINDHVRDVGAYFMQRLETLKAFPIVGDVRGVCLMACVECVVSDKEEENIAVAQRVDEFCQAKGLIVRPYENLCILSPPLIIDKEGVDQIVDILRESIIATMDERNTDESHKETA